MKYIDAEKLIAEIERLAKSYQDPTFITVRGNTANNFRDSLLSFITSLQQEQPELTQVPRIEQETQKKGWMNYGLLISEIGVHRSNAIDRIKETKERAGEIKRNIAPHDLAILGKYLESVGEEIVLCCLQQYCMDFMFTQDEVREIIQQEQPEVDLNKEVQRWKNKHGVVGMDDLWLKFARHFYELGLNARKEETK